MSAEKLMDYDKLIDVVQEGNVLLPDTPGFENARTAVWNLDAAGMPRIIVKCQTTTDIAATIQFAKMNQIPICVHTAGAHSSHAVVDNSCVIDLSLLRKVEVDPSTCTATVQGGATIGDVDGACQPHGLALPMGHVHHTGVAGMALNATSGVGYLCRTRSLTVTFLKSVTLVMSDSSVKTVNQDNHADLFWAVKGAGSNFGVAIEMVFSLTKVSPKVFAGDIIKFGKDTGPGAVLCLKFLNSDKTRNDIISNWFKFFDNAPSQCSSLLVIAPKGGPIVSRVCYTPTESDADLPEKDISTRARKAFEPIMSYGKTLIDQTKMMDYWSGLQKLGKFNPSYYYQKAANLSDIPAAELDIMIDKLCKFADECPVSNMGSGIIIMPLGGDLRNLEPTSIPTAQVFGKMKWWFIVITEFPKGQADVHLRNCCIKWVRDVYKVVEPFASQDKGRARDYWFEVLGDIYGDNMPRLRKLKQKYDPENIFSLNRNILPSPGDVSRNNKTKHGRQTSFRKSITTSLKKMF
mmetsp:Transcript_19079/g.26847  ORF Transcript_19079/g.26847 Transcript_19079/m.26847 type:complete len:519 (-) Transcript_19079:481-2037(-)